MSRILNDKEKKEFLKNRDYLHEQLTELQADFLDMSNEELIECRSSLLKRVNCCMNAILETDEDNLD